MTNTTKTSGLPALTGDVLPKLIRLTFPTSDELFVANTTALCSYMLTSIFLQVKADLNHPALIDHVIYTMDPEMYVRLAALGPENKREFFLIAFAESYAARNLLDMASGPRNEEAEDMLASLLALVLMLRISQSEDALQFSEDEAMVAILQPFTELTGPLFQAMGVLALNGQTVSSLISQALIAPSRDDHE